MMNTAGLLTGAKGAKRITGTSAIPMDRQVILAEEACVVSACAGLKADGTTVVNFVTDTDFSWSSFAVGIPYSVPRGWKITSITLTSGSAVAY